jgi:hypothetical protein
LFQILEILLFPDLSNLDKPIDNFVFETASKILKELPVTAERQVWDAYLSFGSRRKDDLEIGLDILRELTEGKPSVLLALSIGFLIQKNPQKAKNYLKRLAAFEWNIEDAFVLETGYLRKPALVKDPWGRN